MENGLNTPLTESLSVWGTTCKRNGTWLFWDKNDLTEVEFKNNKIIQKLAGSQNQIGRRTKKVGATR